ncbi:MAG: aminotransferase class III-fold pyridoxal phosphate-dependent enzyme, partial [bacterium]
MSKESQTQKLFNLARKVFPGGVNSPARTFRSVKTMPIYSRSGQASYLWDEDGHKYIDCVLGWGSLIAGHNNPAVTKALRYIISNGNGVGLSTEYEVELGYIICRAIPSVEMIRIFNSGAEALSAAVKLARHVTKKTKILKLIGAHHEYLYSDDEENVICVHHDNFTELKSVIEENYKDIACLLIEPYPSSFGVLPPNG